MNKNYINIIRNELTKSSGSLSDADYKEAMDFLTKIEENNDLLKNVYKNLQKMFEEKDSVQKRIDDAFEVTKEFFNVKEPINAEGYTNAEKGAYIKDLMNELKNSYTNDKADIAMPYTAFETLIKGWDAISHGKESLTFVRPDAEQLKHAFENGDWTFEEMIKGYGEFTSSELPPDVLIINKIDDMMVFDSDADAGIQAKKDGLKLIPVHRLHFEDPEDIRAYYESVFIDNERNREYLKDGLITDERLVLNNAIDIFKRNSGTDALELPEELLNAAEVYESSIEDRKTLFIDPVSGNKLLVEDATNGYLTNLFDKNNTLIDHDSFTGYKKEEDEPSVEAMSRFEAGLVTMQSFQNLGIWGDYHNFELSQNQITINELEEEIKNSFENNDFDIGTKEYLGNLLSASMETLDSKPNEWNFLINSGASCSAALHTTASDAYLGDNLLWLLDNIPEPELDKIRKNEKLSLEIVRIAEDSIMNDSNFSVKPTLILAEKLGQLNHAVEYISELYNKNKDEYQNVQNFTEMYNELTDYAHKVNWTIHYVDRIPDEDNDTYSNRFDIEIYNDDEYLRDSLHLDDDSIFNGHFNVSLVVDVPENFNSLNIQELKLSDIDVSYIRIEDKENGYPEEQDIILKEDLLSLFKSNVIQTLRELEQIHDSKQIYIDNPRSNREQMEVNTSLNLYYNNELKDEIYKGNHLINDNAWIGYFKISDSLKYEIVTGSYDGNTIIDLRPTVDTNINNLKGINGKGKINDEEVHVEYRDSEDKEINLDSHWISYAWKDLENLNSNQIKEKFIKDIETHINDSKVLPSLACDYKDFERPYDISLAEIENINKLYKDATNILSKLKTVEDARECEKHYGVLVEIGCDAAGGGLHCTDSLFDNVKPENIEWFRFEQWEELGYIYYPTDGSKPRFDYYRTGEEEALIEDITISEFNNIYLKKNFVLSPSLFAELFNKSVSQDSIIQMDEQAAKAILDSCAEDFGLVYKAGDIYSINGEYKKGLPIEPIEILRHSIIAREEKASSLKDAKVEFIWNLIGTPGGKEKKERIVVDNLKEVFKWYKDGATEKDEFDFIELVNKNPDWTKLDSKESLVIANKLFDFLSCHHDDHFDRKSMTGDDYRYYMDKELISNVLEEKSFEINGIFSKPEVYHLKESIIPEPILFFSKENAIELVNTFEKNRPDLNYPTFDLKAAQKIIEYFEFEDFCLYKNKEGKLYVYDNSEDFTGEGHELSNTDFLQFARSLVTKSEELEYPVYTPGSKKLIKDITARYESLDEQQGEKYLNKIIECLPADKKFSKNELKTVLIAVEKAKNQLGMMSKYEKSYLTQWEKEQCNTEQRNNIEKNKKEIYTGREK